MPKLEIEIQDVKDPAVRESLNRIREFQQADVFDRFEGKFFEIVFDGAVTNYKYPHKLNFLPRDIFQTFLTGAGALTWNYDLFDRTDLDITTTGACTVRALIGRYEEDY